MDCDVKDLGLAQQGRERMEWAAGEMGVLALIRARFEGTPAYLAVFTEGPGAGQPADTAIIWVFATDDCRILSSSFAQL